MSWSLELRNGDLTVEGASLGTCTGSQKLVQDLRCHILEHMGTDSMHPTFGSTLDGGTGSDGLYNPGVIGETDLELVTLEIESELTRIIKEHQNKQLARAKQDRLVYGKATLSPGEVLYSLAGISFVQNQDVLFVVVSITTASGEDIGLEIPLSDELQLSN
jgi:hypothetical protein